MPAASALLALGAASALLLSACADTRPAQRSPVAAADVADVPVDFAAARPRCTARAELRARRAVSAARARYGQEANGTVIHADLRQIAHDGVLISALSAHALARAQAEANRQLVRHVVRIRVLEGQRVLVDANPTSFDVAGSALALRGRHGRPLGRLEITVQDVIGFVKLAIRRGGADAVVVRAPDGRARTSMPVLAGLTLPRDGCVVAGASAYVARSFSVRGFAGGPMRVWILTAA